MPPWDPHPDYGKFLDPHALSLEETQTLLRWVEAGAPRGEGADPLEVPLAALPEWPLGKPDAVLKVPEVQKIPATGVLDYRHIKVANPFKEDVWLSALDVKAGNRKVVHHVILYAKWPGAPDSGSSKGVFFVGWAPGSSAMKYPPGVAKKLPANAELTLELHYTTNGSEETDQSGIALYLAGGPAGTFGGNPAGHRAGPQHPARGRRGPAHRDLRLHQTCHHLWPLPAHALPGEMDAL